MVIDTQAHIDTVLSLKDDSFDIENIDNYGLFLELNAGSLRLCVINIQQDKCICIEDYSFSSLFSDVPLVDSLHELYKQHSFLSLNRWKELFISFNSPSFTFIPDELFRKEYLSNYLQIVKGREINENSQILSSNVEIIGAKNVFSVEKNLWEWLLSVYSLHTPKIKHQVDAVIKATIQQPLLPNCQVSVGLHFQNTEVTIVVVKNKQLQLCNKFLYKVASDMVYFVLFVLKNLNISPEEADIKLYGEITLYADGYEALTRFLPNLAFGQLPTTMSFSKVFEDLPEHRYSSLLNI